MDVLITTEGTPIIENSHSLQFAFINADNIPASSEIPRSVQDFNAPISSERKMGDETTARSNWKMMHDEEARMKYVLLANLPSDDLDEQQVADILAIAIR